MLEEMNNLTTPYKNRSTEKGGSIDSEESPIELISAAFPPLIQQQINKAIEEAQENDPILILEWNGAWLAIPGNMAGQ